MAVLTGKKREKCRVCSRETDPEAPACGHCGTSNPEVEAKLARVEAARKKPGHETTAPPSLAQILHPPPAPGPTAPEPEVPNPGKVGDAQESPGLAPKVEPDPDRPYLEPMAPEHAEPAEDGGNGQGEMEEVGRPVDLRDETYEAYRMHLKERLEELPTDEREVSKCRVVFERMLAAKKMGNIDKALRFAGTCLVLIEKLKLDNAQGSTAQGQQKEKSVTVTDEIFILNKKALGYGVNILRSEKIKDAANKAIELNDAQLSRELLVQTLDMLRNEIREHILSYLENAEKEAERAKKYRINASRLDELIRETRLAIAELDYAKSLDLIHKCLIETYLLREEYHRKTNNFDCPVCGAVNSVEAQECGICGTVFPELGPLFKGERIKVAPPSPPAQPIPKPTAAQRKNSEQAKKGG